MNTAQVLLHRFYCKQSLARFSVKRVAATCVWLSSKLEESLRGLESVVRVFHRIECRRHGALIRHLGDSSFGRTGHGSLEARETRAEGIGVRLPY